MSYFKLGEECILQSKMHPELNGDCIVTEVIGCRRALVYRPNKKPVSELSCGYFTTIKSRDGFCWDESALRKKHKPSTKSLSTMIEELNKVKV
jgi:hypothetical protein